MPPSVTTDMKEIQITGTLVRVYQKQPQGVFYKKTALKNFPIFTGKQLWNLFFKKRFQHVFSCEYSKCFKNTCFKKTSVNDCFWFLLLWFSCTWPIPGSLFLCVITINDFYFHSGRHSFKQPSRHTTSYRRWNDVVCLLGIHFQWNKNSEWSCQTKQEVLKHFFNLKHYPWSFPSNF